MLLDHATVLNAEYCESAAIVFFIWLELIRHATSSNRGILSPHFDRHTFEESNPCGIATLCLKTAYTAVEVPSLLASLRQLGTTSCIVSLGDVYRGISPFELSLLQFQSDRCIPDLYHKHLNKEAFQAASQLL